ncbi:hypothetical protein LCGC14_0163280 [marine sediment metagenome]|uniref:Uncharacterized protein n=1 Tax=marine sediment metagenome TaxID=412755 RepID=A0A0F9UY80_9ZZZZ
MKFSDQEIGYYDRDKNVVAWLPIKKYIKEFPDNVGVHAVMPGTHTYRMFTLLNTVDISFNPAAHERNAHYESRTAFVFFKAGEGVTYLWVPALVKVTVTIDIAW